MIGKIYARLSRDEVGQTSIRDQIEQCRQLLVRHGCTQIVVFFEEPGTSGFKDVPLPERDRWLAEPADVAASWMVDRVSRRGMEDTGRVTRLLEEAGCRYVTVADGVDTLLEGAELNVGLRAIMAREYSKGISKNVKRGKDTGAALGKWGGGPRWFGYATDSQGVWRGPTTIDPHQSAILHEIRTRYVAGEYMRTIIRELNARGVRTVNDKPLVPENMLRLLLNRRYVGKRVHHDVEHDGNWPAIFTEEEWAELDAARLSEERMRHWPQGQTGTRTYLLSGIVHCGRCGKPMKGQLKDKRGKKKRHYICNRQRGGCGNMTRLADPVDLLVKEMLLYRLDQPELSAALSASRGQSDTTALFERRTKLQHKLDRLHRDYYDEDAPLDAGTYKQLVAETTTELDRLNDAISQALSRNAGVTIQAGVAFREAWDGAGLAWRRGLIGMAIDKVVVHPSTPGHNNWEGWRFKPEDIELVWRSGADVHK